MNHFVPTNNQQQTQRTKSEVPPETVSKNMALVYKLRGPFGKLVA